VPVSEIHVEEEIQLATIHSIQCNISCEDIPEQTDGAYEQNIEHVNQHNQSPNHAY
jgi:hypothetical protein